MDVETRDVRLHPGASSNPASLRLLYPDTVTILELVAAVLITFGAGVMQGVAGIGIGVLSVPILTLIDPALTPIPQILLALPFVAALAWQEREHVELRGVGWIVAGRFPGALLGAWLLGVLSTAELDRVIGTVVLLAVLAIGAGFYLKPARLSLFLTGIVSGVAGTTSGIGGPPVALLYANRAGPSLRGNLSGVFTVGIAVNITALAITGRITGFDVTLAAVLAPPVLAGLWTSRRLLDIDRRFLHRAVLTLSTIAAVSLIARTVA